MHIQISLHDGIPIYRQIVNQVKYLVASGQLLPNEELPPIRTLAKQLMITPNTVVNAYRELEVEGVVYKRRGAGTYVSQNSSPLARQEKEKNVAKRIDALLVEARQLGFGLEEIIDLLHKHHAAMTETPTQEKDHVRDRD